MVPIPLLKPGCLIYVSFFGDLVEDYALTLDISVWHVTAESPTVLGAELVPVQVGRPVGR